MKILGQHIFDPKLMPNYQNFDDVIKSTLKPHFYFNLAVVGKRDKVVDFTESEKFAFHRSNFSLAQLGKKEIFHGFALLK